MKKKTIIGVTGGFGTGKTTVARIFKKLGARVIDADKLSRKFMRPSGAAYKRVISLFGKDILSASGAIDASKLAKIVFEDKKKLMKLEKLIHPLVIKEIETIASGAREKFVVIDAPLLIEAGMSDFVEKLVVVSVDRPTQFKRCLKKGFDKGGIKKRIRHQLPLKEKLKAADFIIDNRGTRSSTSVQVKKIWEVINYDSN